MQVLLLKYWSINSYKYKSDLSFELSQISNHFENLFVDICSVSLSHSHCHCRYTKHGVYRSGQLQSQTNTLSKLISQSACDLRVDPVSPSRPKTEMNAPFFAASSAVNSQFMVASSNTAVSNFPMSESVSYESLAPDDWTRK